MNNRKISDSNKIIMDIQNAFLQSEDAKYYHKLDLVMLVVNGMPVKEVAALYNESPTTIHYWSKKVVEFGVESLKSGIHTGRPSKLNASQLKEIEKTIQNPPTDLGYDMAAWNGVLLSDHILTNYKIKLSVRQCQRIMRLLGFTLQRSQTIPSGGDETQRSEYKKN